MNIDELFAYLSDEQNEYGLDPVAAHGFLCASVVGKPMDNWLSAFFEGQENTVSDDVKSALTAWRNELIDTLKNEEPIALPFDDEEEVDLSEEGDIVAWCVGFVDAMYASEDSDWFDNEETEEDVADLTLPMIVLSGLADEDDELIDIKTDDDMMIDLVNGIQDNLTELFLLFHTND